MNVVNVYIVLLWFPCNSEDLRSGTSFGVVRNACETHMPPVSITLEGGLTEPPFCSYFFPLKASRGPFKTIHAQNFHDEVRSTDTILVDINASFYLHICCLGWCHVSSRGNRLHLEGGEPANEAQLMSPGNFSQSAQPADHRWTQQSPNEGTGVVSQREPYETMNCMNHEESFCIAIFGSQRCFFGAYHRPFSFCLVKWRWQLDECKGSGSGDRRPCSAGPGKEQILRELRIDRDCCGHCLQQASLVLPQSFAAKNEENNETIHKING